MGTYEMNADAKAELLFLALVIEHDAVNGTTWGR